MIRRTQTGFTLIELLIAVAVVGLLAAIALPNYRAYMLKADRVNGIAALQRVSSEQQRFRLQNNRYATSLTQLGYPFAIESVRNSGGDIIYSLVLDAASVTSSQGQRFALAITAINGQAADACVSMTLNSQGVKGATLIDGTTGTDAVAECWR